MGRTWLRIGKEPAWGWCHVLSLTLSPSWWVGPPRWARSPLPLPAAWKGHQPAPHTLALAEQLQRPGEKVASLQAVSRRRFLSPVPAGALSLRGQEAGSTGCPEPRDRQRRVAQWDLLASVAWGPRLRVEGPTDVLPYQQVLLPFLWEG